MSKVYLSLQTYPPKALFSPNHPTEGTITQKRRRKQSEGVSRTGRIPVVTWYVCHHSVILLSTRMLLRIAANHIQSYKL